jgi:AAA15 family ATPase/GTPase
MLDSLLIKNFRSLSHLEVSKLGRVNLLVGKNNSGKSTVLEALQIYAGNANRSLLEKIAQDHDEKAYANENEQIDEVSGFPFQDFFPDRKFPDDHTTSIEIGSLTPITTTLSITYALLAEQVEETVRGEGEKIRAVRSRIIASRDELEPQEDVEDVLLVKRGIANISYIKLSMSSRAARLVRSNVFESLPCSIIPTKFISSDELADDWDKIALTDYEDVVKNALRIIEPNFENLVFVRSENKLIFSNRKYFERSAMVKLKGNDHPVPLNSLGDGMVRVLQIALKIFPAKGGFLLIDELENGLHYSSLEKVWSLLFEMAEKLQIQIFATTHSWDCIESFSRVANERTDIDGVLFRLGRSAKNSNKGQIVATVFNEEELCNITQTDVEVR